MAAVTHQTNTFHLLSPELRTICNWLRKIRSDFVAMVQHENRQNDENDHLDENNKQSNKFLAN